MLGPSTGSISSISGLLPAKASRVENAAGSPRRVSSVTLVRSKDALRHAEALRPSRRL